MDSVSVSFPAICCARKRGATSAYYMAIANATEEFLVRKRPLYEVCPSFPCSVFSFNSDCILGCWTTWNVGLYRQRYSSLELGMERDERGSLDGGYQYVCVVSHTKKVIHVTIFLVGLLLAYTAGGSSITYWKIGSF